tara:strand:- start:446 stop:769 length:324 start_codon:yes stop_codon:yes gene_type:complete
MTQDTKFGVSPVPNAAYIVEYRYWKYPTDLVLYDDVCIIPDRFKHVIIDGAMMYMMLFRSNEQSASMHSKKFEDGINMMRRLLVDQSVNVTSTVIHRSSYNTMIDTV